MKKLLTLPVLLLLVQLASAQYYYLDILGTAQTNDQYALISKNNLQRISATSYESNNQPSTDFVLEQTVSNNKQQITTRSAAVNSGESFFTSYYNNGLIAKTTDSSNNAINTVIYRYDNEKQLLATEAISKDFDGTLISVELHEWKYSNGKPETMLKIKNSKDTTLVALKYDQQGNVTEENWKKNNRVVETYYYYYNPKNQLTDIVRYNRRAKQMLPDIMFEYDASGKLYQMIQTQGSAANYLIWRYTYNPAGMKEKEFVFNKQKELLGKIEYNYQ